MAIIQNSAIIQKLIDELELYPALDKVPTELAEKILPVFQVNTEEITIKNPPASIVRGDASVHNNSAVTIYTTPATGKFYLTNAHLSTCSTSATGMGTLTVVIDGATQNLIVNACYGSAAGNQSSPTALNLQNPILLDPGTVIQTVSSAAAVYVAGAIVGYTE